MGSGRLKPGWTRVAFGDMATCINERIDDPATAGVERYVGLEHLDSDSLTIRRWGSPTDVTATKLRFRNGDIIFGRRRVYQRKLAVADFDGICSAHAMVLRAKSQAVLPEFLPFFMQSDIFMNRAKTISVGSLSPTINWKTLEKEEFALSPLAEQRRIASALNGAEAASSAFRRLAASTDNLRRALLINTFDSLMSDSNCAKVAVGSVGEVLMGRQRAPQHEDGPAMRPYLRVANVFDGYIDVTDLKEMNFSPSEYRRYRLEDGDILLNEGQSRELVGRSAIFRDEAPDACFQNTLIRFRSGPRVEATYAHAFFRYCMYTGRFAKIAKQTTSIAHLGVRRFSEILVPLPDRRRQAATLRLDGIIQNQYDRVVDRRRILGRLKTGVNHFCFA